MSSNTSETGETYTRREMDAISDFLLRVRWDDITEAAKRRFNQRPYYLRKALQDSALAFVAHHNAVALSETKRNAWGNPAPGYIESYWSRNDWDAELDDWFDKYLRERLLVEPEPRVKDELTFGFKGDEE